MPKRFPLKFPPGLYHNGTKGQAEGRWYDGNGVRFHEGSILPIGGWVQHSGGALTGRPHAVLAHSEGGLIVGTNQKTYRVFVVRGSSTVTGSFTDITAPYVPGGSTNNVWKFAQFGDTVVATNPVFSDLNQYVIGGPATFVALGMPSGPNYPINLIATPQRFLVVLGGSDTFVPASPTPLSYRRVYWASQESLTDWVPSATNTAGSYDLDTDGQLLCAALAPGKTLLFTTSDVWGMTYIGGILVHAFEKIASNCGAISMNAVTSVDSRTFWMGNGKFFMYDGFVRTLPCEVADKVWGDISATSVLDRTFAVPNPQFNEVTWYYPSAAGSDCDRYVTYNYVENHWVYGQLSRSCGIVQTVKTSDGVLGVPALLDASGNIYTHEMGNVRSGMTPFLDSGPITLDGDGDRVALVDQVIPDDKTQGDVSATLFASLEPDLAETSQSVTLSSPTSVRLTGRQFRLRLTEAVATSWRVGVIRLRAILGGYR